MIIDSNIIRKYGKNMIYEHTLSRARRP